MIPFRIARRSARCSRSSQRSSTISSRSLRCSALSGSGPQSSMIKTRVRSSRAHQSRRPVFAARLGEVDEQAQSALVKRSPRGMAFEAVTSIRS
jgi:hypothetical protein